MRGNGDFTQRTQHNRTGTENTDFKEYGKTDRKTQFKNPFDQNRIDFLKMSLLFLLSIIVREKPSHKEVGELLI